MYKRRCILVTKQCVMRDSERVNEKILEINQSEDLKNKFSNAIILYARDKLKIYLPIISFE